MLFIHLRIVIYYLQIVLATPGSHHIVVLQESHILFRHTGALRTDYLSVSVIYLKLKQKTSVTSFCSVSISSACDIITCHRPRNAEGANYFVFGTEERTKT